jgi:hypothetical protein
VRYGGDDPHAELAHHSARPEHASSRLEEWFENAWNTLRGDPGPGYVHDLGLRHIAV